jgi:hypothetical protein
MRVDKIASVEQSGKRRIEATVEWEEANRPPLVVFAEIDVGSGEGFWPDPNAFLTACALPAWHAGERRVLIDGEICPVLHRQIGAVFSTLRSWYPELGPAPAIESNGHRVFSPLGRQTASFLSCGIDSLAILRANHTQLPPGHPSFIKAVLLIDFVQEYCMTQDESENQARKRVAEARAVARDVGIDAIPVTTNVLRLGPDGNFFSFKWHGAAILFAGHLFSRRFHKICLASSSKAGHLEPWGSHPLLDPFYGSAHLAIEHAGLHLSRLDRTKLVADWPVALDHLLVCQGRRSGPTNCGGCEKCIRTMTALAALGKLQDCKAFPHPDLDPALLASVRDYDMIYSDSHLDYYVELLQPLRDVGRADLAEVVASIRDDYRQKRDPDPGLGTGFGGLVPEGRRCVLADDQLYGVEVVSRRPGRYWGQPTDAQTAVREVEALRQAGADYLVFRPQTFWWLRDFGALNHHLRRSYTCVSDTDRSIVFDLHDHPSRKARKSHQVEQASCRSPLHGPGDRPSNEENPR